MIYIILFILTSLFITGPVLAQEQLLADVHIMETTLSNGESRPGFIAVTDDFVRISMPDDQLSMHDFGNPTAQEPQKNDDMIFDKKRQELIDISHDSQTFEVMNAAKMKEMYQQQAEAMGNLGITPGSKEHEAVAQSFGDAMETFHRAQQQEMEKAMADPNISAEDRRQMEAYLNQRGASRPSGFSPPEVTKTGRSGAQAGISCTWYQMTGPQIKEICAGLWRKIPGGQRTKEMYHAWLDFMESMMKDMPYQSPAFAEIKRIDGFPLVTLEKDQKGRTISEERYVRTEKKPMSFSVPAGYSPEEDSFGMGMHRQERMPDPRNNFAPSDEPVREEPDSGNMGHTRNEESDSETESPTGAEQALEILKGLGLFGE